MTNWEFSSTRNYTEDEIKAHATIEKSAPGNEEYLIADTPEREYWFKRVGDKVWRLDHTWGHFILGRRES